MELITIKKAKEVVGGLGKPSKMPGLSYGTSAFDCITGSKLAKVPGTPCHACYAQKANYQYPSVKKAHEKRKGAYKDPLFVASMTILLKNESYFRWKDSGDLESIDELQAIINVANATPWVNHWLPTQERGFFLALQDKIPQNLIVRISSTKIGVLQDSYTHTSMVKHEEQVLGEKVYECPARMQDNKCGDCRACWDKSVYHVAYTIH